MAKFLFFRCVDCHGNYDLSLRDRSFPKALICPQCGLDRKEQYSAAMN